MNIIQEIELLQRLGKHEQANLLNSRLLCYKCGKNQWFFPNQSIIFDGRTTSAVQKNSIRIDACEKLDRLQANSIASRINWDKMDVIKISRPRRGGSSGRSGCGC